MLQYNLVKVKKRKSWFKTTFCFSKVQLIILLNTEIHYKLDILGQIEVIKLYKKTLKEASTSNIKRHCYSSVHSYCAEIFIVDSEPFFASGKVSASTLSLMWINALTVDLANPFYTTVLFLHSLKTENLSFSAF